MVQVIGGVRLWGAGRLHFVGDIQVRFSGIGSKPGEPRLG